MYKIVDEDLRIASCEIGDLTDKTVLAFLAQWEEGAKIDSLTMFFEREKECLVLNADNERYDFYLALARKYLSADSSAAARIRETAPEYFEETIEVLEGFRKQRETAGEMEIIEHQGLVSGDAPQADVFEAIIKRCSGDCSVPIFQMSMAYNYGVMCGKRAERARRKRGMQA